MDRTTLSRFAVGLVLAAAGVSLFFVKKNDVTTQAQGSSSTISYETKWDANKILTVLRLTNGGGTGSTGIGVWGWKVEGVLGSTSFEETWSAPSNVGSVVFNIGGLTGCSTGMNDTTNKLFLAGCVGSQNSNPGPSTYNFQIDDVGAYHGQKRLYNDGTGFQQTNTCYINPRDSGQTTCLAQVGAYSFMEISALANTGAERIFGIGTLMPLHWDVTGTITQGSATP